MSKVIIKKMSIHYFKGIKSLEVDFKENISNIAGPNGSGKSTIADAFTWCLFGKNMKGESDTKFLIKTVDKDGVEIPHVNHEVIITLDVDGNNEVLKRVLVQDYDKDDNLKGNHTEYFWNDVPYKKYEYDVKVQHIIDEEIFKLITSPFEFLSIDWKIQRDMLMNMAGDINDIEIASKREDFTLLLANLSGKSIEDYKKEIAFKISRLKEEMSSIPARIDEVKRGMPDMSRYGVAVEDIKKKNDELKKIAEEQNLDEAKVTKNEELQVRKMAILDEIKELNAIVARKELMESSEKRIGELETSLSRLGAELASLESNKMVAEEFEIAKMDEVGKRVNSLFSIVKWQMFTRQVNGENVPACIALVDGVRWTDANTASKINAGIDIASTLARVYGVSAPMFIDNAECSGNILNTEGQQILLRFDNKSSKIELF